MSFESQSGLEESWKNIQILLDFVLSVIILIELFLNYFLDVLHLDFKPLTFESMENKLFEIAKAENLSIHKDIIKTLITTSNGDMRNAITTLQNVYIYKNELKKKSSKRSILQLLNDIDDDIIADTIKILKNKNLII